MIFGYTTFSLSLVPLLTKLVLPIGILAWLVLIVPAFAAAPADERRTALWFILLPGGLIGFCYLVGQTFLYPRHLIVTWPALLLLVAQAPLARWSTRVAFGALLLVGVTGILHYQADPRFQKEDWRGLVERAVQHENRTGRKMALWGAVPAVAQFYCPGKNPPGVFDVASATVADAPAPPRTIVFYHGYRADLPRVRDAYARQGFPVRSFDYSRMKALEIGEPR